MARKAKTSETYNPKKDAIKGNRGEAKKVRANPPPLPPIGQHKRGLPPPISVRVGQNMGRGAVDYGPRKRKGKGQAG